jgi:small subunit ribosomal protein S18
MSDQINPTGEEQEATEEVTTSRPVVPTIPTMPAVSNLYEENDFDGDDADDEGDGDDDSDGDDESTAGGPAFEGPAEYVQREKSGRGRRIGGDVRPDDVDYKNIPLLSRFLDRRGRILSRRKTRVSAKVQRRIVQAIKRARHLALLPYTADQTRIVRSKRR